MASDDTRAGARILIVDSDLHLRGALQLAVQAGGATAVGVATLAEARAELRRADHAGMILEATLPDGFGLTLLDELRSQHVHLPVLVTSSVLDPVVANRAHYLRAACVFKPNIAANVRMFVARSTASTSDTAQRTMAATRNIADEYGLTERERQIIELVALGISREGLVAELGVKNNTLKTQIRRLLAKCREPSLEGLARAVLDEVLLLSCTTEPI